MNQTDEELVALYREDGSEEAINTLVGRYVEPVYNLVVRLVGDRTEAEDLTQETFMKMWRSLARFDIHRRFKTWLFAIARNSAVDYLRKARPILFSNMNADEDDDFGASVADESILQDEIFEKREMGEQLEHLMEELSLDERTIIVLRDQDEMGFEDIAEILGKPVNTVKSRYRRALAKMRRELDGGAPKL
jgi:RNA polymerase sigma-70 factor (ECF subfamily)